MNKIFYRLEQKITTTIVHRRFLGPVSNKAHKINLVLYFDYEREFGNPLGGPTAEAGFRGIIDILAHYGIRATWNCVGLIAEHYRDSLRELASAGHELASHTYTHVDVTILGQRGMGKELTRCKERFAVDFAADVIGFHPPRDHWSILLPTLLKKNGYRYMIVRDNRPENWRAHYVKFPFGTEILCIPSLADDWGYIENHCDADAMLRFWKERISKLECGSVAAIGFHPWVIGADPSRLQGFAALIEDLVENRNVLLNTGRQILEGYEPERF